MPLAVPVVRGLPVVRVPGGRGVPVGRPVVTTDVPSEGYQVSVGYQDQVSVGYHGPPVVVGYAVPVGFGSQ